MIKEKFLRVLSVLAAVILVGGIHAGSGKEPSALVLRTGAVGGSYEMTDEYMSGRYYQNLVKLELSGDEARDVIAIALSQLGYHEGDSASDFSGESTMGSKDFVEYNVLYGKLDNGQGNGMSYGYYWCASFVNWCLRQAGIPEEATAGAEVSCQRWISDCKSQGIFVSKGGYIPKEGDIIFFKDKGSSVDSTHVGLVRYSDGHDVYTVEGNTSNGNEYSSNGEYVALKSHSLSSSYIVGYATPKYKANKTAKRVDRSGGFLSTGQYISTEDLPILMSGGDAQTAARTIPNNTIFAVTEINEDTLKISHDGTEGYVKITDSAIQLTTNQNVYAVTYLNSNGDQIYMPQYCIEGQEKNAYSNTPKREKSGFVGWSISGSDKRLSPGDSLGAVVNDITLTAIWDDNYYVVTFKAPDGTVISQKHGYYGSEYDIPDPPAAEEGFVFFGWGDGADGTIRENASYTAQFISEDELQSASATEQEENESADTTDKTGAGCLSVISALPVMLSVLIGACGIIMGRKKQNV